MYNQLARSSILNSNGSAFFKEKLTDQEKIISSLVAGTSLLTDLTFDDVELQNKRLNSLADTYRTPAGCIDFLSNTFGIFEAAKAWRQLDDEADQVHYLQKLPLNSTQLQLVRKAELKMQMLQWRQISSSLTPVTTDAYKSFLTLPFPNITDFPKDSQIKLLMKIFENVKDARDFLEKHQSVKSESEYYLSISNQIRERLKEEIMKYNTTGFNFSGY